MWLYAIVAHLEVILQGSDQSSSDVQLDRSLDRLTLRSFPRHVFIAQK